MNHRLCALALVAGLVMGCGGTGDAPESDGVPNGAATEPSFISTLPSGLQKGSGASPTTWILSAGCPNRRMIPSFENSETVMM